MDTRALADAAADVVRSRTPLRPEVGLICGTGFGPCTEVLTDRTTIPYRDLPGFRESRIPGHVNELDVGVLGSRAVAACKAKILPCDGATWAESGLQARLLARVGCRVLLYSANSGSLVPEITPGTFVAFTDHINFAGVNPLAGEREGGGWPTPFLSMAELYDAARTEAVRVAVREAGIEMPAGVHGFWQGPSFETPAEIRLARLAGCVTSGNSAVPEVMAARHAGLPVVAFTFVSVMSAGIAAPIELGGVLAETARAHGDYRTILRAAIPVL